MTVDGSWMMDDERLRSQLIVTDSSDEDERGSRAGLCLSH
jgi:hypothetical protein